MQDGIMKTSEHWKTFKMMLQAFSREKKKKKKPMDRKNRVPAAMGGELVKGEMPPWRRCF